MDYISGVPFVLDAQGRRQFADEVPGGQDGTPLRASVINPPTNEIVAAIIASGQTPDANALQLPTAFPGRLLRVVSWAENGVFTWQPGRNTTAIVVGVQGAGGAGGGCAATGSNQQAVAWGGTSGCYAQSGLIPVTTTGTSVSVTVGAGGASAVGAQGGRGGDSAFGSFLVAPGGDGGGAGSANTVEAAVGADVGPGFGSTGTVQIAFQVLGAGGGGPIALGTQLSTRGGTGGRAHLGPGGNGGLGNGVAPRAGVGGGGGGGEAVAQNSTSAVGGAGGGDGVVIVWEYA